jgi:BolA protein
VKIVATAFAGQPLAARHRMVYAALGALMQKEIHMLAIDARAPDEVRT